MGAQHWDQQCKSPPGPCPFPAARAGVRVMFGLWWRHWECGKTNDQRAEFLPPRRFCVWGVWKPLLAVPYECFFVLLVVWGSSSLTTLYSLHTLPSHLKTLPSGGWEGVMLLGGWPGSQCCLDLQCPAVRARALVLGFRYGWWWYPSECLKIICCL